MVSTLLSLFLKVSLSHTPPTWVLEVDINGFRGITINISVSIIYIIPWLMNPGGSKPHSQGLSNFPYLELNQSNSSY